MDKSPDAFRTISEAADELDLPQHVLRFWETRFNQIAGVVTVGIFANRPADVLLIGGGSGIEAPPVGITGVPMALVNVLMRPFLWEGGSPTTLLAAAEMTALWIFVVLRRRQLLQALRGWRKSRLLCLSFAFILLYAIPLGMVLANLGILARQRIFLFPFFFVFLEAVPATVDRRSRTAMLRRSPFARARAS